MATMTLSHLHTFYRLSQLMNFTRTAEELGLTPPAITLQVKGLSAHFGVPLVEIIKRRPVLTEAGRFLAERSRSVLDDIEVLEREMREFTSGRTGQLTIGTTLTIGNYALPTLLARFRTERPEANVSIRFGNAGRLTRLLRDRQINFALAIGAIGDESFATETFDEDRLVLVVPPSGHPLSTRRFVRAADLAGENFIARESTAATRVIAEREFAAIGVPIKTHLVLPSLEGVSRAVEAGLGIAILSWLVVERAVGEGRLHAVEIRDVDLRRDFNLVTVRDRVLSPLASEFIAMMHERRKLEPAAGERSRRPKTTVSTIPIATESRFGQPRSHRL
ncbi:MAG: LysR family transcriptional regulator [Candidatus Eremiobacteraeota bacterium]|nr:LysR family transcriptional regulator [Candidatus Eremiobacteraeota bacterium]